MAASASPRWCTVLPCSSAAPYSVTMTSTWWRGVVITAPASNHGTMRDRSSSPTVIVDGRQSSERSSRSRAGPATKSSWPPMPEYCAASIVSAITWPWMSTDMAALIVTIDAVAGDELGRVHELDRQEGHLAVLVQPVVELPRAGRERRHRHAVVQRPSRLVTLPAWWSRIRPVVNISEWMP